MATLLTDQSRSFEIDSSSGQWIELFGSPLVVSTDQAFEGTNSLKVTIAESFGGSILSAGYPTIDIPAEPGNILTVGMNWYVPSDAWLGDGGMFVYSFDSVGTPIALDTLASASEIAGGWNSLLSTTETPPGTTAVAFLLSIALPAIIPPGEGAEIRYYDYFTFEAEAGGGAFARPLRQRQQDYHPRQRQRQSI